MAFSSAITSRSAMRNKAVTWGTFDADSVEAGDIDTGLRKVDFMVVQTGGAAVSADQSAVNETLPADGSAISIACTDSTTGYWLAIGD